MKPPVGGPLHLMAHLPGACASRRKLVLRLTTVILLTPNGLASPEKVTKEEDQFNFHGVIIVYLVYY